MEKIELLAKSSSSPAEPYTVTFTKDDRGGVITVRCTCRAGIFGKCCKHKLKLALGNDVMLFDEYDDEQFAALETASGWITNSSAFDIMQQIRRLEREADEIKAKIKQTKKVIGQAFTEGFK